MALFDQGHDDCTDESAEDRPAGNRHSRRQLALAPDLSSGLPNGLKETKVCAPVGMPERSASPKPGPARCPDAQPGAPELAEDVPAPSAARAESAADRVDRERRASFAPPVAATTGPPRPARRFRPLDEYQSFEKLTEAALEMVAERR
jgi:hypothetical protein